MKKKYITMAEEMRDAADRVSEVLKALSNPHRLMIVCKALAGEISVGELARYLEVRPTVVSQHLSILRREGIVKSRREGQTIYYSIKNTAIREVLESMHEAYCMGIEQDAGDEYLITSKKGENPK